MSTPSLPLAASGNPGFSKIIFNPAFGTIKGVDRNENTVYSGQYTTARPSQPTIITSYNGVNKPSVPVQRRFYYDFSKGNSLVLFDTPVNLTDSSTRKDGKNNGFLVHGDIDGTEKYDKLTVQIEPGVSAVRRTKSAQAAGCARTTDIETILKNTQLPDEARMAFYKGKEFAGTTDNPGTQSVIDYDDTLYTEKADLATGTKTVTMDLAAATQKKLFEITKDSPQGKTINIPAVTLDSIKSELLRDHPGMQIKEVDKASDLTGKTLEKNTIYVLKERIQKVLNVSGWETRARQLGKKTKDNTTLDNQPEDFTASVDGKPQTFQNSTPALLGKIGDRIAASYHDSGEDPVALANQFKDQLDIWDLKADIALINP